MLNLDRRIYYNLYISISAYEFIISLKEILLCVYVRACVRACVRARACGNRRLQTDRNNRDRERIVGHSPYATAITPTVMLAGPGVHHALNSYVNQR